MSQNLRAAFGLLLIVPFALVSTTTGCSDEPEPSEPAPNEPAPELSAELQADLQASLDKVVSDGASPGAAMHVAAGDESWSGAAGVAVIDGAVPMAPDSRFRAGSMLKPLVAAAVLQSVEQGALALDDLLTDHLPAEVTDRIEHADGIDVGMLLGHRSGIPDWVTLEVKQMVVADAGHVWSVDEILGIVEEQDPTFEPGSSFAYSNTNYILLGEILSVVEKRAWREVVRERVLDRAGMDDSSLPDPGDIECPGCAHGYVAMDDVMFDGTEVDPSMAGASGGHALVTTAPDLVRFLGQLRAGALFDKPEALDTMLAFQPADDGGEAGGHLTGYGLGVMRLEVEGDLLVGHLGGTAGYVGFVLHVPATDRYVSGFMNIMGDPSAIILPVAERLAQP